MIKAYMTYPSGTVSEVKGIKGLDGLRDEFELFLSKAGPGMMEFHCQLILPDVKRDEENPEETFTEA